MNRGDSETLLASGLSQAELLPLVRCPVCTEVPKAKVFQCGEGHHLCEACYCKLQSQSCPVCRAVMPKEPCRSRTTEDLVEKLQYRFPCKNVDNGCQETCIKSEIDRHEKHCNFRAIECPIKKGCKMSRTNVVDHIKKDHSKLILPGNAFKINRDMLTPANFELFHLLEEVTFKPSLWYVPPPLVRMSVHPFHTNFFVQADLGNPIYNGLCCEIRVHSPGYGHMMFRCQIFDLEDSVESMIDRQVAGCVGRKTLQNLMKETDDGSVEVEFDIVAKEKQGDGLLGQVKSSLLHYFGLI